MWNTVKMDDGKYYLVDLTNIDGNGVGSPDKLFLKGMVRDSASQYHKAVSGGTLYYEYYPDTISAFPSEALAVSSTDYAAVSTGDFTVKGGVYGTDYIYYPDSTDDSGMLKILTDTPVTISNKNKNSAANDYIVISSSAGANITLDGVNIVNPNSAAAIQAAVDCGAVNLTLADGSVNTVVSKNKAAVYKTNNSGTLTIKGGTAGTGILNATTTDSSAAAIGGCYGDDSSGNITIKNCTVNATAAENGAAIGGAYNGTCGSIILENAIVTATAHNGAAIGAGKSASAGDVFKVIGGSVKTAGTNSFGGGSGKSSQMPANNSVRVALIKIDNPDNKDIILDDGTGSKVYPVKQHSADDTSVYAYLPIGNTYTVTVGDVTEQYVYIGTEYVKVNTGDFEVTGGKYGTDYKFDSSTGRLTILTDKALTIANKTPTTATNDTIFVNQGVNANITLDGVNIDASTGNYPTAFLISPASTGNVTITLAAGSVNTIKSGSSSAGIEKNGNDSAVGTLTIDGTGTLNVQGGEYSAGIGGAANAHTANITIKSGIINAKGGASSGSAIGGGHGSSGSNIVIEGGIVNASSAPTSAAIGGNGSTSPSDVAIKGGVVITTGIIGGGQVHTCEKVLISGGTVTADSIGSRGTANSIVILGGSVKTVTMTAAPKNNTENVYPLKIANPEKAAITIDGAAYTPVDHTAADSADTNLYVYLTGTEHMVNIGGTDHRYVFDSTTNTFKEACIHELERVSAVEATCIAEGTAEHWRCTKCDTLFSDERGENETTLDMLTTPKAEHSFTKEDPTDGKIAKPADCITPAEYFYSCSTEGCTAVSDTDTFEYGEALGHDYKAAFTWASDYSSASAVLTCKNNNTHTQSLTATVNSEETAKPTCTKKGVMTYTAKAVFDGKTYTDTKTADIPMTAHSYTDKVQSEAALKTAATCDTKAVYYFSCAECGEVEKNDTHTFEGDALGHKYGEPVFTWTDYTATAKRICDADPTHTESLDVSMSSEVTKPAACTETGTKIHTAAVKIGDETFTSTKEETLAKTAHSYTDKVQSDAALKTAATCDTKAVYYFSCAECGEVEKNDNHTFEGDALGHKYGEPVFTWTDYTATAKRICDADPTHTESLDVSMSSEITKPAACTETGTKVHTATVKIGDETFTSTKTEVLAKTEHVYENDKWANNETHHWHGCKNPDCTEQTDKAAHTPKEVIDKAAAEFEAGIKHTECEICGYIIEKDIAIPATHEHSFADSWSYDADNHWYKCTASDLCTEVSAKAAHTPKEVIDKAAGEFEAGIKHTECEICGYIIEKDIAIPATHEHKFADSWSSDETGHWYLCTASKDCSEKNSFAKHTEKGTVTLEPTEKDTGLMTYSCTECGYEIRTEVIPVAEHKHTLSDKYSSDADYHWYSCGGCDEKVHLESHTIDRGTLAGSTITYRCTDCGYIMSVEVKKVYNIVSNDSRVTIGQKNAEAGSEVYVRVEFGYDACIYSGGKLIAAVTDGGRFIMPAGDVTVAVRENGAVAALGEVYPNSYIFSYDSDMKLIRTNSSRGGIKGTGDITVKLGPDYAGREVTLYSGRKKTTKKLETAVLDENGRAVFTVSGGRNYTLIVED